MQEFEIKDILIINKSQMSAFIRKQQQSEPELTGLITNRMVLESLIYIKGYVSAIEKDIMLPVIEADVHQMLLEQGFKYIKSEID